MLFPLPFSNSVYFISMQIPISVSLFKFTFSGNLIMDLGGTVQSQYVRPMTLITTKEGHRQKWRRQNRDEP